MVKEFVLQAVILTPTDVCFPAQAVACGISLLVLTRTTKRPNQRTMATKN